MTTLIQTVVLVIISLTLIVNVKTAEDNDTEITRVKPLTDEEKARAAPQEKTESIYLVNLVTVPRSAGRSEGADVGNDLVDGKYPSDPRGRNPALFFLQKVNDDGRLPDGIYYRPAKDQKEISAPVVEGNVNDAQAFLFGRGYRG